MRKRCTETLFPSTNRLLLSRSEIGVVIDRKRRRGSFLSVPSTYKFDQQKSLPRMMMTTRTTRFARLLSSFSVPLSLRPMDPVVKSGHCPNQRSARYGNSGWESEYDVREPASRWTDARLQLILGKS